MSEKVEIGDATLYHGDCLEILGELAGIDAVITDPPYSSGGAYRSDRTQPTDKKYQISEETNRSYATFSGDNRDQRSFEKWCVYWMSRSLAISNEGAGIAAFIDWRNLASMTDALQISGWVYRGIVPWHKGSDQRPRKGWFRANVEYVALGSAGPLLTGHMAEGICEDGIIYCRNNGLEKMHQTGKPVELMERLIGVRESFRVVLDPFMGSGTTGAACINLGRKFIGIEIDRQYFDIACERIEACYAQGRLFA